MSTGSRRPTLKDISEICGYSINTVSLALRNNPRIPEDTRDKIRETASSLGYIPNSSASSLRSGRSNLIAIIVDDILNLYYAVHIVEIEKLLRLESYTVMILCTHNDAELERQMLLYAISHNVDGIMLSPLSNQKDSAEFFQSLHVPLVLVDRDVPDRKHDLVCVDDYQGGRLAGQVLCRAGHKSVLYIAGPESNNSEVLRLKGLQDVLQEITGTGHSLRVVRRGEEDASSFAKRLDDLLLPVDYTAVISFNDDMAYQALLSLEKGHPGSKIPVIGFDHLRSTFHYLPPLASIACSSEHSLSKAAVSMMLRRIAEPDAEIMTVTLPVQLYEGEAASLA